MCCSRTGGWRPATRLLNTRCGGRRGAARGGWSTERGGPASHGRDLRASVRHVGSRRARDLPRVRGSRATDRQRAFATRSARTAGFPTSSRRIRGGGLAPGRNRWRQRARSADVHARPRRPFLGRGTLSFGSSAPIRLPEGMLHHAATTASSGHERGSSSPWPIHFARIVIPKANPVATASRQGRDAKLVMAGSVIGRGAAARPSGGPGTSAGYGYTVSDEGSAEVQQPLVDTGRMRFADETPRSRVSHEAAPERDLRG